MNDKVRFYSYYFDEDAEIDFSKPYIYYNVWSDFGDERDEVYNPLIKLSGDKAKKYSSLVKLLIEDGFSFTCRQYFCPMDFYWSSNFLPHK